MTIHTARTAQVRARLDQCISAVAAELRALPEAWSASDTPEQARARQQACQRAVLLAVERLEGDHGARIRLGSTPARITLGGVCAHSTAGAATLLRQWLVKAATRRAALGDGATPHAIHAQGPVD